MARFNDSSIGYGLLADRPSSPSGTSTRAAWIGSSTFSAWEGSTWTQYGFAGLAIPVTIPQGGHGQTSAVLGFDALSPTTTKGDLIVRGITNNERLPMGVSNGQVLVGDTSSTQGVAWRTVMIRKTSDEATSSLTPVDVAELSLPVAANRNYVFDIQLFTRSSSAGEANYFSVNGPTSPTNIRFSTVQATSNTAIRLDVLTAYDTANPLIAGFGGADGPVQIRGTLENGSNAGNLVVRFWTETGGAESATVRRGSWMRCEEVA